MLFVKPKKLNKTACIRCILCLKCSTCKELRDKLGLGQRYFNVNGILKYSSCSASFRTTATIHRALIALSIDTETKTRADSLSRNVEY